MQRRHRTNKQKAVLDEMKRIAAPGYVPMEYPEATCPSGKRRWSTRHKADISLIEARQTRLTRARGNYCGSLEVRVYECARCDGFHLTSMYRREYAELYGRSPIREKN